MGISKILFKGIKNITQIAPKNIRKANHLTDIPLQPAKNLTTDTFVKTTEKVLPDNIQKLIDQIAPLDKYAKEFYTSLYQISPKKFDYIYKNKYFQQYIPLFNDKEFLNAIKDMSGKEIHKTFDEVTDLYKTLPHKAYDFDMVTNKAIYKPQTPNSINLAQLTILKHHNPDAYKYIMNISNKETLSDLLKRLEVGYSGSAIETLTIPQIRQIQGVGRTTSLDFKKDFSLISNGNANLERYVISSDAFSARPENIQAIHDYLSKIKVTEPFTAFRAERDTGMFKNIILPKNIALKTKLLVLKNFLKARKISIHDYTGKYDTAFMHKSNFLKYILAKRQLSLADAMQVAKFGDDSYRKQIIDIIKNSQITDNRFKSVTFDRQMAVGWLPTQNEHTTGILHNVTIEKGTQGIYSPIQNRQAEFILNNNDKIMTFQNVKYDPDKDLFYFDTTIK